MTPELRKRIEEKAKEHLGNYDPNTDVAWTKMNDFLAGAEAMHGLMNENSMNALRSTADYAHEAHELRMEVNRLKNCQADKEEAIFRERMSESKLAAAEKLIDRCEEALNSANKTLLYAQEEYAHGHGVNLIYETVQTNKRALTAIAEWKRSNEREEK